MYASVSDLPKVVRSAMGIVGYHRKDVEVKFVDETTFWRSYGNGYRAYLVSMNLSTGEIGSVQYGSWGGSNPFTTKAIDDCDETIPIPADCAVLSGNQGGNRPVSATLYVSTSNAASLLPSKEDITKREEIILAIMKGLKACARKEAYARHDLNVTEQTFSELQAKGLVKINKAGSVSLTTKGKNHANKHGLFL